MDRETYNRMRELEERHWWFAARREILADQIGALKLPPAAEIVEVGCGTGGNLRMLSAFGHVRGIEPDDDSRAYAQAHSGIGVEGGSLPDLPPAYAEAFDLVAAFDVIEHVDDDAGAVAAMARLLKPGGRMIATVPAYGWMWSQHDVMHHHKRRYVRPAFTRLFDQAGLQVTKATYFNTALFPVIGGIRLVKTALGSKDANDDAMPKPWLNDVLRGVFGAERGVIRHLDLPFGVSILVHAERPA